MMIGTTLDEARFTGLARPALFELDETGLRTQVIAMGVADADASTFIETYRKMLPGGASASDIYFAIASDRWLRMDSITQAERKSKQPGTAPVYMYLFARGAPSRYKAGHTVEIPFVFDNLDLAPGVRGPTLDPRDAALARQVSAAWAAFARTGNPNHPGLEQWRPYETRERATMVFDWSSHLVNDPRKAGRLLWAGKSHARA
jgi:para-nitrobenzyl esterase